MHFTSLPMLVVAICALSIGKTQALDCFSCARTDGTTDKDHCKLVTPRTPLVSVDKDEKPCAMCIKIEVLLGNRQSVERTCGSVTRPGACTVSSHADYRRTECYCEGNGCNGADSHQFSLAALTLGLLLVGCLGLAR